MDNFITGQYANIKHLTENDNFQFLEWNIENPIIFENLKAIYNLACPASPKQYQAHPIDTMMTSVVGMRNLLDLATLNNCPILQASTSEVYGNPLIHPQVENYFGNVNPNGIRSCYDEGKRAAESLCMDYNRQFGTKIKIIRIFNTYGPRMDAFDGRVVSNFIIQALTRKPITIYGDGLQTRSFMFIDDLIDVMVKMIDSDDTITGPINVGNPNEITMLELVKEIEEILDRKLDVVHETLPQDDPCKRKPDITMAKEKLNWSPKYDLKYGLQKTIEYFKDYFKISD